MVIVPSRFFTVWSFVVGPAFGATAIVTAPLPIPDPPTVIAIQPAFDDALHAQPEPALTDTLAIPPATLNDSFVGATEYVHGAGGGGTGDGGAGGAGAGGGGAGAGGAGAGAGGAGAGVGAGAGGGGAGGGNAAWPIVIAWSATWVTHARAWPWFASTANRTDPFPLPASPAVTWTHVSSVDAVHVQPVSVDTVSVMVPPAAETAALVGKTANLQGAASCDTGTCDPLMSIAARRETGCAFASTR
jgi:hypothetical protein